MSEKVVLTRWLDMRRGGQNGNQAGPVITIEAYNGSGGAVARGDIVIWDKDSTSTADKISFTTTTTGNNPDVLGMVLDTSIASLAFGKIQIYGPTSFLKVNGTTDISVGDYISTFTVAKIGQKTTGAGAFAMALETYATNDSSGVIDAFINCLGSSFGGSAAVSWYRDNVPLYFGDANDVAVQWNGTNFTVLPVADGTGQFLIGNGTTDMDLQVFLGTTSEFVLFDLTGPTVDFGADGMGVVLILYGETASALLQWDQSNDQLVLSGNASINYLVGSAPTNHTPISVGRFVASAASGGGFVVTSTNSAGFRSYCEATADLTSAAMVRSVLGRFLITGAITSNAECFGVVGQLVAKAATIQHDNAGVMGTFESQTTAVTISGTGGDHVVAAVMGRVGVSVTATTVNADGILAGVAAMSNITAGYVTVTGGGILAAFYAGQFSAKQDWDYGLYVAPGTVATGISLSATGNGADITSTALAATGRVGKFVGTHAAAAHTDGYGSFEVDITLSGSPTNHSAASSSWVNITGGTVPAGTYICARNDGVYEAAAATITNAKIVFGARMQKLLDDTDALSFPFSVNTNNTAITALIDVNNITDLGTVANAGATAATLLPILRTAGGTLKYVLLYDLA